jgi:hypothetical protein
MNFKVPSAPYEILLKDEKNKRIIFLDFAFSKEFLGAFKPKELENTFL